MMGSRCVRLVFALLLPVCSASADDWPQWRGSQGDAVWRETDIVDSFPKEGPPVLWRLPISAGYAGPAVADGRIFLMDRVARERPEGEKAIPGTERCFAVQESTGELIWEHTYECPYQISYPEGPRTTATVVGERVYFLGAMGRLACHMAATGDVLWEQELNERAERPPVWGYSAHPVVDGDVLYIVCGGEGSTLLCLNRLTGEEIWSAGTTKEVCYSPPVLYEQNGERQLLHWNDVSVTSYNPEDGTVLWTTDFPKKRPMRPAVAIATPLVFGNQLLVTDFYNGSLQLRIGSNPPSFEEIWSSDPEDAEHKNDLNCLMGTPVIFDGHAYGVAGNGELRCVTLGEQKVLWRSLAASSAKRPAYFATSFLIRHEDRWILFNDQGDLKFCRLSPEGYEEICSAHILEATGFARGRNIVWSHPALANGRLYARNDKELVCYDLRRKE